MSVARPDAVLKGVLAKVEAGGVAPLDLLPAPLCAPARSGLHDVYRATGREYRQVDSHCASGHLKHLDFALAEAEGRDRDKV